MAKTKMIIVGGFLGAGKTTLLAKAAGKLAARGVKVGLVTNDQAANLVDTGVLRQAGQEVKEVAGACFCCAFNRMLFVCDELIASFHPDVIIGEPVGSCTDLSATVLQPMKKLCRDFLDLSPYTVLIDPAEFLKNIRPDASTLKPVRYIYRKQIEEADLVVVDKVDTLSAEALAEIQSLIHSEFPGIPVRTMSSVNGNGVDEWLGHDPGRRQGGPANRRGGLRHLCPGGSRPGLAERRGAPEGGESDQLEGVRGGLDGPDADTADRRLRADRPPEDSSYVRRGEAQDEPDLQCKRAVPGGRRSFFIPGHADRKRPRPVEPRGTPGDC